MAPHVAKQRKAPKAKELDLDPDAWPKFEEMIRKVSKAGPQHKDPSVNQKTPKNRA